MGVEWKFIDNDGRRHFVNCISPILWTVFLRFTEMQSVHHEIQKSTEDGVEWKFIDNDGRRHLVNAATLSSTYITTWCIYPCISSAINNPKNLSTHFCHYGNTDCWGGTSEINLTFMFDILIVGLITNTYKKTIPLCISRKNTEIQNLVASRSFVCVKLCDAGKSIP